DFLQRWSLAVTPAVLQVSTDTDDCRCPGIADCLRKSCQSTASAGFWAKERDCGATVPGGRALATHPTTADGEPVARDHWRDTRPAVRVLGTSTPFGAHVHRIDADLT